MYWRDKHHDFRFFHNCISLHPNWHQFCDSNSHHGSNVWNHHITTIDCVMLLNQQRCWNSSGFETTFWRKEINTLRRQRMVLPSQIRKSEIVGIPLTSSLPGNRTREIEGLIFKTKAHTIPYKQENKKPSQENFIPGEVVKHWG